MNSYRQRKSILAISSQSVYDVPTNFKKLYKKVKWRKKEITIRGECRNNLWWADATALSDSRRTVAYIITMQVMSVGTDKYKKKRLSY